ncbi:MAG: copper homeostasis protein CutC [Gemmatimonadota bacterium]|nr:copper homeostasis protein CutC [Gemmatimonadota bacterium]
MGEPDLPGGVLALTILVEAYVDSIGSARSAEASGAGRLELCGPGDGGLTPSPQLLAVVMAHARVPVHVMVRPREGGFTYTADEFAQMERGVELAKGAGAAGVVFGILREEGALDVARMRALIALARPLRVACHRAFDRTPDADGALDTLLSLGVDLVLTSGHAPTATEGAATIARHVRRAGEQIVVLAGGTVRAENVAALVRETRVREVHARATDAGVIAALVQRLHDLS